MAFLHERHQFRCGRPTCPIILVSAVSSEKASEQLTEFLRGPSVVHVFWHNSKKDQQAVSDLTNKHTLQGPVRFGFPDFKENSGWRRCLRRFADPESPWQESRPRRRVD